ncbi:MAG: uracil-DNA glycosylase family protein, partial [Rhizobiaceae bacterium]
MASLAASIAQCRICRDHPLKGEADRLPHEPRPVAVLSATARLLIAGQAPG